MKLLFRTDVHQSDFSPHSRIDNWAETISLKLIEIGQIAKREEASLVIDGGDFFHIKSPSRNSHNLIQDVIRVHKEYPCPVAGNIGNHDVKHGNMSYLSESPLGVLYETGVFQRLYDDNHIILKEGPLQVRVVGVPYHGTKYDMERFKILKKQPGDTHLIVTGHLLASQGGGSMFEGEDILCYADLYSLCPDVDVFHFGHWHKNQGIHQNDDKSIINIGSISRGSLSQDDVSRIPSVALVHITTEGISIEEIPLQIKPSSLVFDLVSRIRKDSLQMTTSSVVSALQLFTTKSSITSIEDQIRNLPDLSEAVRERALHYLEQI